MTWMMIGIMKNSLQKIFGRKNFTGEKMTFAISNNEFDQIKSSIIKDCNVINIDENDFPGLDDIVDILSLDYKNSKINLLSANPNGSDQVSKIIVSIVSNINLTLHETSNILTDIRLQYKHSEIILGIGKRDNLDGTIVSVILFR